MTFCAAFGAVSAVAQGLYEPIVIVNQKAITNYEVDQRAKLLEAFGTPGNLTALSLEQLTDDKLRLQAAEDIGLELDESAVDDGFARFSEQRNLSTEQVEGALRARGISVETLRDFIRATLIWREVVQVRFRARATPSDQDLDAALEFANRAVQEEVLLQEISIPVAQRGPEATGALARDLSRSLNRGGDFTAAVRRYSRAGSAGRGGRVDWLPASNLPPQIAGQVLALLPGEVTAPIDIPQGVTILKLLEVREIARNTDEDGSITLTYTQLIVPLASTAPEQAYLDAETQLNALAAEAELCSDLDAQAESFGFGSGRSNPTPADAVPAEVALTVAGLDVGQKSTQRDARGVTLVMLCSRSGETSPEEREDLRLRLFNQRMAAFGQGYLQELRGDALIERR